MSSSAMSTITVLGFDVPTRALTLEGFRSWAHTLGDTGPRLHFYRGRIHVEMSLQSYDTHCPVVEAVGYVLERLTREEGLGRCFPGLF